MPEGDAKPKRILITQTADREGELADAVRATGAFPLSLPLFDIHCALPDAAPQPAHLIIFVSRNAVRCGLPLLRKLVAGASGPVLAAVGPATAAALEAEGYQVLVPASGYTSEHLLQCLQEAGLNPRRCLIFRGEAGRELLQSELSAAGWHVETVQVYRRVPTPGLTNKLCAISASGSPDLISLMSGSAVELMGSALDDAGLSGWFDLPAVVPSPRVAEVARERGFTAVVEQADPSRQSLLAFIGGFVAA